MERKEGFYSRYYDALNVLNEKVNGLYQEYSRVRQENPIEHIKYRIKTEDSIKEKLQRRNLEYTLENVESELEDVVGVRIVCSFLSDLDDIIEAIMSDPDLRVVKTKDYILNPKKSGYTSYHILVRVPISNNGVVEYVPAEIQVRTMAMDLWASLEHKIRYKSKYELDEEIEGKLLGLKRYVSSVDRDLDAFMQEGEDEVVYRTKRESFDFCTREEENEFFLRYRMAINALSDKFNRIKNTSILEHGISPIEHIKSRIKTKEKMISKLKDKGEEVSLSNLEKNINDIGAIKIVCSFHKDAIDIINMIMEDEELVILEMRDFISSPKPCGYSAYHFVVAVPVTRYGVTSYVKTEIQVRTMCMELWANLEHKLCFQKDVSYERRLRLRDIAVDLRIIEDELDEINEELSKGGRELKLTTNK